MTISEQDLIAGVKRALQRELDGADGIDAANANRIISVTSASAGQMDGADRCIRAGIVAAEGRVISTSDLNCPDEDRLIWTNWHHKLEPRAQLVSRNWLKSWDQLFPLYSAVAHYGASDRRILWLKGRLTDGGPESILSDGEEPYANIHLSKILAPIMQPNDIFTGSFSGENVRRKMAEMSMRLLTPIEQEHRFCARLQHLVSILLGDDPYFAQVIDADEGDLAESESEDEPDFQRITRRMATDLEAKRSAAQSRVQRFMNMSQSEIAELVKVLQAALDRSSEYLRCLQRIRQALTAGERFVYQVECRCKEAMDIEAAKIRRTQASVQSAISDGQKDHSTRN